MVLPSISPLSDNVSGLPVNVPPPLRFRPLKGSVTNVRIGAEQIVQNRITTSMSLAKIAGVKYEQQFLDFLRSSYPHVYIRPHIHFKDDDGHRTVIPDAVLFDYDNAHNPHIKIFEVKSQHMPEAWWQLEKLYKPVLSAGFPQTPVLGVEVVKSFDSQMPWPGEFVIFEDIVAAVRASQELGVLKWRKT